MWRSLSYWAVLLACCLTSGTRLAAQDSTTSTTPQPSARQQYEQVFEEWKQLIIKLRDLRTQFVEIAEDSQTDQVRKQFLDTVAQVQQLLPRLRQAAVEAFKEDPNADRELTRFLVKLAEDDLARDLYDDAYELTKVLIEHQCEDKRVYDLGGMAAFAVHDFKGAEEFFREAESLGVLAEEHRRFYDAAKPYQEFWTREQELREKEAAADDLPRVRIETTKGELVVELFENEAPETVGNFISLVEKGFYDGRTFHRVLPGFMAQGGCPIGDGTGGPGYRIYCECYRDDYRKHFRGTLSMAHSGLRDTGGSQFFITFLPTPHLNGHHTAFGRVIEGMDVLAKLQRRDPDNPNDLSITPDSIVKAEVIRKRDHAYLPNKVQ